MHSENEDLSAGLESNELFCRCGAIHLPHREIHHDHVGVEALPERDCFFSVGAFADDLDVLRASEHCLEACTNDCVIVHEHHFYYTVRAQAASVSSLTVATTRVPVSPILSICSSPPASERRSLIRAST